MALTKIGATLGGSADVITVTQSSHGLYLGYPVKMTSSGYAHATADTAANAEAVGIVIATDRTGANTTFSLALGGRVTVDGCVPNLTAGTVLFLQVSAGLLAAAEPSGNTQVSKPMAVITIANSEMIMVQQRGEVISTAGITLANDSVDSQHYAADSIDNEHLANDAVGADELAANAVVNDSIASGAAINFSKMENLTASRLLVSDGNGDVSVSSVTTTNLTDLTDAGETALHSHAGGGSLVLIGTEEANNTATTLTVTGLNSTYDTYLIAVADVAPADNDKDLYMRFGDSSGIDSGASDYQYHQQDQRANNATYEGFNDDSAAQIVLCGNSTAGGVGSASGRGAGAVVYLHRPADGAMHPSISGTHQHQSGGGNLIGGMISGERKTNITLDRIEISFESGSVIHHGRLTVWGLAHA